MNILQVKIALTIQGPLLTHGLGAKQFGLDTTIARDVNNCPVLPGSLIKGNLLHGINELNQLTQGEFLAQKTVDTWFGRETKHNNEPDRGMLNFDYHWHLDETLIDNEQRTINRIKIDDELGTVSAGSLQVIESPFLQGKPYTFTGYISCYLPEEEEQDISQQLSSVCSKVFQYIGHLGALKSIGFGKILAENIAINKVKTKVKKERKLKKHQRLALAISFDRPVCFSKQTSQNNLFTTEEHMTGAILKGAIANKIANNPKFSNLQANLEKIIISWFKPSASKNKVKAIPLSVAYCSQSGYINELDDTEMTLEQGIAKIWQSDWKYELFSNFTAQNTDYKAANIVKSIVVRTAINHYQNDNVQLKNTAKKSQLFSYQCIEPHDENANPVKWHGTIELSATENIVKVIEELQILFTTPLLGLGKTKAQANITLEVPKNRTPISPNEDTIAIVLEADTLIDLALNDYQPCHNILQAYQQAFKKIAPELELLDLCVEQHLQGGAYYWHRYLKATQENYQPLLLTNSGSVFVFKNSPEAKSKIERWLLYGIDPSHEQLGNKENQDGTWQENWQTNPFNRGNGYGEISLLPATYLQREHSHE